MNLCFSQRAYQIGCSRFEAFSDGSDPVSVLPESLRTRASYPTLRCGLGGRVFLFLLCNFRYNEFVQAFKPHCTKCRVKSKAKNINLLRCQIIACLCIFGKKDLSWNLPFRFFLNAATGRPIDSNESLVRVRA